MQSEESTYVITDLRRCDWISLISGWSVTLGGRGLDLELNVNFNGAPSATSLLCCVTCFTNFLSNIIAFLKFYLLLGKEKKKIFVLLSFKETVQRNCVFLRRHFENTDKTGVYLPHAKRWHMEAWWEYFTMIWYYTILRLKLDKLINLVN